MRSAIIATFFLVFTGCATTHIPNAEAILRRMKLAYARCDSFADDGILQEITVESGETNRSTVAFATRFIRDQAFRMELDVRRTHGAGPFRIVYYHNGTAWSTYDSLDLTVYDRSPVHTNLSPASVFGSGLALGYDLFPDVAKLLEVDDDLFSGFIYYSNADVEVTRVLNRPAYHLILDSRIGSVSHPLEFSMSFRNEILGHVMTWEDTDRIEFWVDAESYLVIGGRRIKVLSYMDQSKSPPEETTEIVIREYDCFPRVNCLSELERVEFLPPMDYGRTR